MSCAKAKTAVMINMQFRMLNWVGPDNHVFDEGAHWCTKLVNMIEPSMCGGDAASCQ